MKVSLKGFFVCDKCREQCFDGVDEVGPFGPNSCAKAYHPRKQVIDCLGPYCDQPCPLQKGATELTFTQLIDLVNYLGDELNTHLVKPENQ